MPYQQIMATCLKDRLKPSLQFNNDTSEILIWRLGDNQVAKDLQTFDCRVVRIVIGPPGPRAPQDVPLLSRYLVSVYLLTEVPGEGEPLNQE